MFSTLYHRKLNTGRVVSPTLAMIVNREKEINDFISTPYYTVTADLGTFTAVSDKITDKAEAERISKKSTGKTMLVKSVTRTEKYENPPLLYDLTTLQRDANRILGYTAKQTLDYLQSLYEKKLITYPRTDSRCLTNEMADNISSLTDMCAYIYGKEKPSVIISSGICNSSKVTDHHAVIPTAEAENADYSELLHNETLLLKLICRQVLMAVSEPYRYTETVAILENDSAEFTAKGKSNVIPGWKIYDKKDESIEDKDKDQKLPVIIEWDVCNVQSTEIKEGHTTPPKHYTEDTVLQAMENAGTSKEAERKGLGTPATRASMIEKLIDNGFVERVKNSKHTNLIPTETGITLAGILPDSLKSPELTAEWENKLKIMEKGDYDPYTFMDDIRQFVTDIVNNYTLRDDSIILFPSDRKEIGKCPRCGCPVTESKHGYFCENTSCSFAMWRDNRYLNSKRINLTQKMAEELLKDGRSYVTGLYSEKTGKRYEAFVVLNDDKEHNKVRYTLEFNKNN